jgi:hypothetical protein
MVQWLNIHVHTSEKHKGRTFGDDKIEYCMLDLMYLLSFSLSVYKETKGWSSIED